MEVSGIRQRDGGEEAVSPLLTVPGVDRQWHWARILFQYSLWNKTTFHRKQDGEARGTDPGRSRLPAHLRGEQRGRFVEQRKLWGVREPQTENHQLPRCVLVWAGSAHVHLFPFETNENLPFLLLTSKPETWPQLTVIAGFIHSTYDHDYYAIDSECCGGRSLGSRQ